MGMGIIWSFAALILAAVMMALINPLMAALCLALQLFATLITNRAMPAMRNLSRAQRNALGHTSAIISEYMSLNPLIKS